jgi:protein-ribulosamine 3-kinase
MIPEHLKGHLEDLLQTRITHQQAVGGGDINQAARLDTADRRRLFLKYNRGARSVDMFRAETLGLALLGASRVITVPKVLYYGDAGDSWSFLLMEFIYPGHKNRLFWESFGQALANLHGNTSQQFGFSHDNFIGCLPQSNARHISWPDFYAEERLWPQMLPAQDAGLLNRDDEQALERLCRRLPALCPEEAPALIHGDLWSGNFLCTPEGQPVLIDPAACFAHREMDLAMSRLFSGFDDIFYQSYQSAWPLEPGFEERLEVYQLYYLLVHINLFGGEYVSQVRQILKKYA